MSQCLTDEQFEILASERFDAPDAARLRAHLAECSTCREAFEECRANLPFESTVRAALGGVVSLLSPTQGERPDSVRGYEILEEVHRGAQGVVYRAVQRGTDRLVAIKFLREGEYACDSSRRRFDREIELAARLEHPNIIRVSDSGVSAAGRQFYVMDYVEGLPLHHYVHDRRLGLREALELFAIVCEAVNFAHQRGVMHRDLKPSNILVDAAGVPRVLDFGLAKQLVGPPETALSVAGQVVGTLPYMSPEQAGGGTDQIDIRTDVYALGMILYYILTGRYAYPVTGPITDVLSHIARTPPTPPRKTWNSLTGVPAREKSGAGGDACPIDDDVETIILRALAKQPARRYQNVAMLSDDIRRYLDGQPIEAQRDVGLIVLRRALARYKAAAAVAATGVLIVALAAVMLWWMYQNQSRQRELYEMERARAVAAQAQLAGAVLRLGDAAMARADLDDALGQYLAALAMNEHLAAGELNNPTRQQSLADTILRIGDLHRRRMDAAKAREYYGRYERMVNELSGLDPEAYSSLRSTAQERLASVQPGAAGTRPSLQEAK